MTEPKWLEFTARDRLHWWRLSGEPRCGPTLDLSTAELCYRHAIDALGVAQRSDLVIPNQTDRIAVAKLLHEAHPEVSEQAWASQLDPDSEDRAT